MNALTLPSKTLVNLAFAGVGLGLFTRGLIIMAAAGPLSVLPDGPTTEQVGGPSGKSSISVRSIPPFPGLAPEKEEKVAALVDDAGPVKPGAPSGPLVPIVAEVVGITFFDVPEWSLVNVVINGERNVHSSTPCVLGSRRPCNLLATGYTVKEILKDRIRILHEASGQIQEIGLFENTIKAPVVAAAPAPAAAPTEDSKGKGSAISKLMDDVKQTGANSFESPPGMRENVLGRLAEVAMEGRWLPYFENGKISGFKLAQTVPNSAFGKIGLQAGDVIKSVNGFDISSPDKMLDVFSKLRDAKDVNVDIQRGDAKAAKTQLKYTIN